MNQVAGAAPEQIALCENLSPRIVQLTDDFFTPGRHHPYLDGLASGGTIQEDTTQYTHGLQAYTITGAKGFRDTLDNELFDSIGIPREVALNGLVWAVMTMRHQIPADPQAPSSAKRLTMLDKSLAYWDSSSWHVWRQVPGIPLNHEPLEELWQISDLKSEELDAMQVTVSQTQGLYAIAELFDEDRIAFERIILKAADDEQARNSLILGLRSPFSTQPYQTMLPYMHYYSTGYQQLQNYLKVAHRIEDGRSFELDSTGLKVANYNRPSQPSSPDMLLRGENFPLGAIHPPVPRDILRYYRQPSRGLLRAIRFMDTVIG